MKNELLGWIVYEINTDGSEINGVMFRGRIRKLGLTKGFNVLVENTQDKPNSVRFAVLSEIDAKTISEYVRSILNDATVSVVIDSVQNPVLSKLKVNLESRYTL